jgi:hypothetical protein
MDQSTSKPPSTSGGQLLYRWFLLVAACCILLTCGHEVPQPKRTAANFPPDTPKALILGNLPDKGCNGALGGVISALEKHIVVDTVSSKQSIINAIRNDAQGENRISVIVFVTHGATAHDGNSTFLGPYLPDGTLSIEAVRAAVQGNPNDPNNKVHAPFKLV